MNQSIIRWLNSIEDEQLPIALSRLDHWFILQEAEAASYTESRAKALLKAMNVVDGATINAFASFTTKNAGIRLALYNLIEQCGLQSSALEQLPPASDASSPVSWLVLTLRAIAFQREYPINQLDPAAPPALHSPAGQIVQRAGNYIRKQSQYSPTERDRIAKKLAFTGIPTSQSANLSEGGVETPVVPSPEIFRPPVPVNYPELNPPVTVSTEDGDDAASAGRLIITEEDLTSQTPPAPIQVTTPTPPTPLPYSGVAMPNAQSSARPSLTVQMREQVREQSNRIRKAVTSPTAKTAKLRVVVQQYPDGPGIYGLQIRVHCKRVRAQVAGITNRDGIFLCQVPVREKEGLTYQVELTWHRDYGGDIERKSITLNNDRTEFQLPFYRQVQP